MQRLRESEQNFWECYLATLRPSDQPAKPFVSASFAGNAEITNELLDLYLTGKKTAGSSLVEDFISANDPLPAVGNYWIFLDSTGEPRCILKTVRIELNKFRDIPKEIAVAEGEGDLTVEYWKRVHSELYSPHLRVWGLESLDEATVITEFFQIVFR